MTTNQQKLVYCHENRYLVHSVKDLLQQANISVLLRNEFAAGAAGDIAPVDTWLELWVNEDDITIATQLIKDKELSAEGPSWVCAYCHEENGPAFNSCWHCGKDKS